MAPPYTVVASQTARNQLATLYLKYRRLAFVAYADNKIEKALTQNPQGGFPIGRYLMITVHPLQATYEIVGDVVKILTYEDSMSP